ncbi:MAG: succinate dehydrogenase assembly factor 2 [Pseudomonadota bacterium]
MTSEPREVRIKRLRIRSWRRGIKEMDLILGGYADAELVGLDDDALDLFEAVLGENDHDLFEWVTGQAEAPPRYAPLMADLSRRAAIAR